MKIRLRYKPGEPQNTDYDRRRSARYLGTIWGLWTQCLTESLERSIHPVSDGNKHRLLYAFQLPYHVLLQSVSVSDLVDGRENGEIGSEEEVVEQFQVARLSLLL